MLDYGMNLRPEGQINATVLQDRLEATRHLYDEACNKVAGNDEVWEEKKKFFLAKISALSQQFDGASGAQAAYFLGQISSICEELQAPARIKAQWEDAQKRFQRIFEQEESLSSLRNTQ